MHKSVVVPTAANKKQELYLWEKINRSEKGNEDMGSVAFNGGLMLHNPVREVHRNTFVSQEIKPFEASVGFEQIPEVPSNSHCNWSGNRRSLNVHFIALGFVVRVNSERKKAKVKVKFNYFF